MSFDAKRFFRYLAPNLVTFASLAFGMASIVESLEGRFAEAGWFVVFSVMTDKLDGFVARLVKGTSEFGVQLDSFADFLNFGIAPATLWYAYLTRPELPAAQGGGRVLLVGSVALWVLAVTFRLARYNIVGDDPRCKRIFFGVPTTLMGGMLVTVFLTFLKYGADPSGLPVLVNDEPRLLPGVHVDSGVWAYWPALVTVGALLMASTAKIPKLGLSRSKLLTVVIFANVVLGYAAGATRHFPEYAAASATVWIVASIVWGWFNEEVRRLHPPPIFPRQDLPAHEVPQRPEEDALPDEEEEEGGGFGGETETAAEHKA
jgi:CDP-diacylglycerol--serine O-phosphatidyltransferase